MDAPTTPNLKRKYTKPMTLCDYCGRKFRFLGKLEKHKAKHVSEVNSQDAITKMEMSGTRVFTCLRCQTKFLDANKLYTHKGYLCRYSLDTVHTWACESCDKKFDNESGLSIHKGYCRSFTADRELPIIRCEECGDTFTNDFLLKQHARIHTVGTEHLCVECNKPFSSQRNLDSHMSIHTGTQKYQCKECPKKYTKRAALLLHHQTFHVHNGERRFQCDKCGKYFAYSHGLKRHMNTHIDVSVQCNRCGRQYKEQRHLARHKCKKSADFLCHNCGKAFKLAQTLQKHQSTCSSGIVQPEIQGNNSDGGRHISEEQITTEQVTTEQITTEQVTTEQITTEQITTEQTTAIFDMLLQAVSATNDDVIIESNSVTDDIVSNTVTVIVDNHNSGMQVVEEPTVEPDVRNVEPDVRNVEPDVRNVEPDVTNVEPDVRNVELDVRNVEPDVRNVEPDVTNVEQDVTNADLGVTNAEQDVTDVTHVLWQCSSCGIRFEKMENVHLHAKTGCKSACVEEEESKQAEAASSDEQYSCVECPEIFSDIAVCIQHIQAHRRRQCKHCYKELLGEGALLEHLEIECEMLPGSSISNSPTVGKHICSDCRQKFISDEVLERHRELSEKKAAERGNDVKCLYCSKHYTKHCQLVAHLRKYRYKCKVCHVHCRHLKSFVGHIRQSHRAGHVCKHCKQQFACVAELKAHIEYNAKLTDRIDVTCFKCGLQCEDKLGLEKHGADYEVCRLCGRHFAKSSHLSGHLKIEHAGINYSEVKDRPTNNRCRHCDVSFATAMELGAHVKQVLKDAGTLACGWERDAIMCLRCGANYKERWKLTRHFKLWKFECQECNRHFRWHRQLFHHMQFGKHQTGGVAEGDTCEMEDYWTEQEEKNSDVRKIEIVVQGCTMVEDRIVEESPVEVGRKGTRKKHRISSDITDENKKKKLDKNVVEISSANDDASVKDRCNALEEYVLPMSERSTTGRKKKCRRQAKTKRILCQHCGMVSRTQQIMRAHIKACHKNGEECHWRWIGPEGYQCSFCQKVFARARGVIYHIHMSTKDVGVSGVMKCVNCGDLMSAKCQADMHAEICQSKLAAHEVSYDAVHSLETVMSEDEGHNSNDSSAVLPTGSVGESFSILEDEGVRDQKLIELNPDIFYRVKFPPGMLAKLVSTEGKNDLTENNLEVCSSNIAIANTGEGKEHTVISCIIPVVSLESISNIDQRRNPILCPK